MDDGSFKISLGELYSNMYLHSNVILIGCWFSFLSFNWTLLNINLLSCQCTAASLLRFNDILLLCSKFNNPPSHKLYNRLSKFKPVILYIPLVLVISHLFLKTG